MSDIDRSRLVRPLQEMPVDVRDALLKAGLMDRYRDRPAYQRNDYLLWIASAKREETRKKRIGQMLGELEAGRVYMKMRWERHPSTSGVAPESFGQA